MKMYTVNKLAHVHNVHFNVATIAQYFKLIPMV